MMEKTVDIQLQELREQIALEIELACQQALEGKEHDNNMKCTCNIAASIARGF
jgi:hypothetical protein